MEMQRANNNLKVFDLVELEAAQGVVFVLGAVVNRSRTLGAFEDDKTMRTCSRVEAKLPVPVSEPLAPNASTPLRAQPLRLNQHPITHHGKSRRLAMLD
jgi:hypothetical protein